MKIAVVMLAAGNSRRFGANKLFCRVEGQPLFIRTIRELVKAGKLLKKKKPYMELTFTAVVQYGEMAELLLDEGIHVVYNPHPEEGISSSLKIGLLADRDADACAFCVADQPMLRAETVAGLLDTYESGEKGIGYVIFEGRPGSPSVFSKKYFDELLDLTGDVGGKRVIAAHREDSFCVEAESVLELEDMDTKEQYERLIGEISNKNEGE